MFDSNQVLTGTNGNVWLNGVLLFTLKKIEAKATGSFEDVNVCDSYATYPVYTGWTGEGTLTIQKVSSLSLDTLGDAFKNGKMPELKIITKLKNPTTEKAERVALYGVKFTEFNLANFEAKGLIEEEIPFRFTDYELLEKIAS